MLKTESVNISDDPESLGWVGISSVLTAFKVSPTHEKVYELP